MSEIKTAKYLREYLDITSQAIGEWSQPEAGEVKPWYRGQKRADWDLIPGEYRFPDVNADEIRSEFMLKASELLPRVPGGDWEWYFIMQHYGLPTRLLDWTTGSLIGLHFALCHDTGRSDAAVWMLDPWELNSASVGHPDLLLTSDREAQKYLHPIYSKGRKLPPPPVAIVPPYNSARITVQRGTFTVHGRDMRGLNEQFGRRLLKIVVPKERCLPMRRELRNAGISEFTVFPDLDGLCRDIRALEIEGC